MKLPIPSLFTKKEPSNYYLALLLRDDKAVSVVLEEINGSLKTIGTNEVSLPTHLEEVPYEELLELLDKSISKAEELLPSDVETEKTIFGVKDSWVEDKKIKKEFLSKLKKLCDALSLQPIGFMVVSEAVSHLLTKEEGAPLSAILAEIGKTEISLTLFRAGRVIEAHAAHIEDDTAKTVDRLLHHFTTDVLPSRIIVSDGGHSEDLAQEFLAHHWSKSIPFLHLPQISLLPQGFDGKAMVYGAAEQMNFTVFGPTEDIKILNVDPEKETKKHPGKKEDSKAEVEEDEPTVPEKDSADKDLPTGENFGFVTNQDISTVTPVPSTPAQPVHSEEVPTPTRIHDTRNDNFKAVSSFNPEQDTDSEEKTVTTGNFLQIIPTILSKVSMPKFLSALPLTSINKRLITIPVVLVLLLVLGGWYLFSVKGTITLHMQSKHIDDSTAISLRTDSGNDLSQKILTAKEVDTSVDGSLSVDATGKKEVGDKAKGTITLYNSSDSKKTIPAGTTITSSNSLDFITDKEAVVASASGDIFSGTKPGTTQTSVTAKSLGTEYNLPSGTKFTLPSSSSVAGKNDSAFSGGTKKEVTVVAKKDVDTLTANLPKELEGQARDALKGKASGNIAILPVFTEVAITKKSLDNEIGDEAKKVTMKATVTFSTLSYNDDDIQELAQSTLKGKYDQDLAISDKGITTLIKDVKVDKNNQASATLTMSAGLLPKLNKETITKELTGKSFTAAAEYLKGIPQVQSADINLSPNLPLVPKILPRFTKNLTVITQTDD